MPFKSDAQRKYLYANRPEVAKKFAAHRSKSKKHRREKSEKELVRDTGNRLRGVFGKGY